MVDQCSYRCHVLQLNIAMLLDDEDATNGAFGVLLADVADVVAVLTHSDGRPQVLATDCTPESLYKTIGYLGNCLLDAVGHLGDSPIAPCLTKRSKCERAISLVYLDSDLQLWQLYLLCYEISPSQQKRKTQNLTGDYELANHPLRSQSFLLTLLS